KGIDQQPKIEKVPQYPRWRKWAIVGMISLPILTLSGFAIAEYIERRPSNKTIILVADFQGNDQRHAVTQTVINSGDGFHKRRSFSNTAKSPFSLSLRTTVSPASKRRVIRFEG